MLLVDDLTDGGCFSLDRMPTTDEAPVIRDMVGLKKKPSLSVEYRASLLNRFNRKVEQIGKKGSDIPSTRLFHSHELGNFRKPVTEMHPLLKPSGSWNESCDSENAAIVQSSLEIEILERCKFIGKLYPWKPKTEREVVALLVPIDTALEEIRYETGQPDFTRIDFVKLLERHNVSVFSNIDQFVKARETSQNAEIISQTRMNARASHSIYA